ncbi:MAG: tetratricopeptide repeat protein [Verrucomicrobiota bacterium]
MELVRGVKITDYCDQNSLTTEDRLRLFIPVCQAVQHAHQKGIIHRDIKPSNILVTSNVGGAPLPVVIDFGIAKATDNQPLTDNTLFTAFEMLIGTPAYMSPEQAELTSVDVDTRTDIYSLGVLLYELLTGSTPFDTNQLLKIGVDEIRRVIREQEPLRPSTRLTRLAHQDLTAVAQRRNSDAPKLVRRIRGDLDWIAMKALEKNRTRRYETANGLALDIQRYLSNEPVSARAPNNLYRFQKTVLRNKLLFGCLAAGGLLTLLSLVVVSKALTRERQARLRAETEEVRSRQLSQFLKNMLNGVGPAVARGRDTVMLREILDQTAQRLGLELAGQPLLEEEMRRMIGRLYLEIGNYDRAEEMHRAALALSRRHFGTDSLQTASALDDLGLALWRKGRLPESEQAFHESIAIRRRALGPDHPDLAGSLNNLANVYRRWGRLSEAVPLAEQALSIRRRRLGNESLEVADSLRTLCILLGDQGRRNWLERSWRYAVGCLGPSIRWSHPRWWILPGR